MKKKSPLKAITADAALVQAAFKHGQSTVPTYDPEVTKMNAKLAENLFSPTLKALKTRQTDRENEIKARKKSKDNSMKEFITTMDAITRRLGTYDKGGREAGMHEQIYNNTYDYLEGLKDEYEVYNTVGEDDTPENKKKRIEVLGRLDQCKSTLTKLRGDIQTIGTLGGSGGGGTSLSPAVGELDILFMKEVANMDGDYSNVTQRWEDDQIYFDVVMPDGETITKSSNDLRDMFIPMAEGAEEKIVKQGGEAKANGKKWKEGDTFDRQAHIDTLRDIIVDENTFADLAQRRLHGRDGSGEVQKRDENGNVMLGLDGKPIMHKPISKWQLGSWAHSLEAHPSLNSQLYENVGIVADTGDGKGGDPDGIVSEAEARAVMLDPDNKDLVISALVDPKHPAFDFDLSVNELLNKITMEHENAHNIEVEKVKAKNRAKLGKLVKTPKGDFGYDYDDDGIPDTFPIKPNTSSTDVGLLPSLVDVGPAPKNILD